MVKLHVLNNRHGPHDGILISSPEDYVGIMGMSPNWLSNPRCSMVLVHLSSFIYIWVIFRATVGKYSIHGAYGNKRHGEYLKMTTLFVFFLIFWPIPKAAKAHPFLAHSLRLRQSVRFTSQPSKTGDSSSSNQLEYGKSKWGHDMNYIYMAQRLVVPPCHPRWWWSLYVYVYKLCVYII